MLQNNSVVAGAGGVGRDITEKRLTGHEVIIAIAGKGEHCSWFFHMFKMFHNKEM